MSNTLATATSLSNGEHHSFVIWPVFLLNWSSCEHVEPRQPGLHPRNQYFCLNTDIVPCFCIFQVIVRLLELQMITSSVHCSFGKSYILILSKMAKILWLSSPVIFGNKWLTQKNYVLLEPLSLWTYCICRSCFILPQFAAGISSSTASAPSAHG